MQQNSEGRDHVWEDKLSSTLQGQWKSPISWYLCMHWLVVGVIHIDVLLFATAKRVGCEESCFTCPTLVQELCTSLVPESCGVMKIYKEPLLLWRRRGKAYAHCCSFIFARAMAPDRHSLNNFFDLLEDTLKANGIFNDASCIFIIVMRLVFLSIPHHWRWLIRSGQKSQLFNPLPTVTRDCNVT